MNSASQVIVYNSNVNLSEKKSALNNDIQEVVTVGDLKGYKVYSAKIQQSGTDAPIPTVLMNNIGEISWQYQDIGLFNIVSETKFTNEKVLVFLNVWGDDFVTPRTAYVELINESLIGFMLRDYQGEPVNNMSQSTIEIRVYE